MQSSGRFTPTHNVGRSWRNAWEYEPPKSERQASRDISEDGFSRPSSAPGSRKNPKSRRFPTRPPFADYPIDHGTIQSRFDIRTEEDDEVEKVNAPLFSKPTPLTGSPSPHRRRNRHTPSAFSRRTPAPEITSASFAQQFVDAGLSLRL